MIQQQYLKVQQYNNTTTVQQQSNFYIWLEAHVYVVVSMTISVTKETISVKKKEQQSNNNDLNIDLKGTFQQYQSNNTVQFDLKVQQYMSRYNNIARILKSPTLQ